MKIVRILLIIGGVLLAALLIIPLFVPATAEVQAETVIDREPGEIFPLVASFKNRELWDPWATSDTTTVVRISPRPGYVGSTYAWEGKKIGTGRMEVIAVEEPTSITSNLWFGDLETPSLVKWTFEPVDGGTLVTWRFSQETGYPLERLAMMFGKVFLRTSFEHGLRNLKILVESISPQDMMMVRIEIVPLPEMAAMVAPGGGTPQTISSELGKLYGQTRIAYILE
ncbi:MAG: SRPBCC family protein [Bacteroidales bacterium]